MDYLISVALEFGSVLTDGIRVLTSFGVRGKKGIFRQSILFAFNEYLAYTFLLDLFHIYTVPFDKFKFNSCATVPKYYFSQVTIIIYA